MSNETRLKIRSTSQESSEDQGRYPAILEEQILETQRIHRFIPNLKKRGKAQYSIALLHEHKEMLNETWARVQSRHARLLVRFPTGKRVSIPYFTTHVYEKFEEAVIEGRVYLAEEIGNLVEQQTASTLTLEQPLSPLVDAAVTKNDVLSDAQRLQCSNSCLQSDALLPISNLSMEHENVDTVSRNLEGCYNNPRLTMQMYFQRLCSLKEVQGDSTESLMSLVSELQNCLAGLRSQASLDKLWDCMLAHLITNAFDNEMARDWENSLEDKLKYPNFRQVMYFLKRKYEIAASLKARKPVEVPTKQKVRACSH